MYAPQLGLAARRHSNLRSIYAMLIAVAMFALMDCVLKLLSTRFPPIQIASLRALTSLPLVLAYVGWRGALPSALRARLPLHALRGALSIATVVLFVFGLRDLSMAQAYALFFISPSLITALSMLVLKERVDLVRWLAIAAGLGGVLVALRPSSDGLLSLGGLAILGSAACYAVSAITARVLGRTDRSEHTVLWVIVFMGIGATVLAAPIWVAPKGDDFLLLFGLAVSGFLGQLAITEAFNAGQASVVAPFEYSALAYGVALDWALWHTLPDQATLLGAAIIIGSGIYLIRHERGRDDPPA